MCEGVRLPAADSVVTSAKKCFFSDRLAGFLMYTGKFITICLYVTYTLYKELIGTNKFLGNERGKTSLTLGSV